MKSPYSYQLDLRGVTETPVQLFFVVDEALTILDCDGFEKVLPIKWHHAIGKSLDQVITGIDWDQMLPVIRKCLDNHELVMTEIEHRTSDSSIGWLHCTCTPFWESTGDRRAIVSIVDITEKRQAERQFLLQEKMTSLSKLAANIAHEINNPLEAILNRIGCLLIEDFKKIKLARVKKELELIQEQVYQISATTNALIAFSKDSKENFRPQDVNSIVAKALELCRIYRDTSAIAFDAFYEANLALVPGNEVSLEQCFVHILNNAVDATPARGKIQVKTCSFKEKDQTFVQIRIIDNGCGMNSETMENIFDPFFTTQTHGRGSGLGLSIAYGIVADHRGLIRVTSEVNKGSEFSIILPVTSH